MKKLVLIFELLILTIIVAAQTPQAFKYQAVARDLSGNLITNQNVSFKISILQGSETGPSAYSETHDVVTNDYGLVLMEIGSGTPVSGNFSTIDWGGDSYFLNIELDETGGNNYQQMGTSLLHSVPLALHSETAGADGDWIVSGDDMYSDISGNVGVGNSNPEIIFDVFGNSVAMVNGMIARFDSDETDYSRIVIDGAVGADAQISFMNNGSSKWTIGNDASDNNTFVLRKGFGEFGTDDILVITSDGQADLNLPLLGNQGGLNVGKKAAEASGQTFSIVRSIGAHSIDTRYVTGFWAQSFGAYNAGTKLGNLGLAGSNKNIVDFMSFGSGGNEWWDMYSKFSVDKFGNVGIGRFAAYKSPTAKLEIDGFSNYDLLKINTAKGTTVFFVDSLGMVGIGTDNVSYNLVVNGDAAKPGSMYWTIWADKKLKNLKSNYNKGLNEIIQLDPVIYSYKKESKLNLSTDVEYTGLIAQEVQKVFPEAVKKGKEGYLALDMQSVNMAMLNAVKELNNKYENLEDKNIELESRVQELETLLEQLISNK